MRLTIAATLLTQAIPAASSSQSKNVGPLQKNKNIKMRRLQARKQRLDKAPAIQRSVLLEDPAIENMSLLKNSKKVECDPSSQLLDVGILSCGAGLYSCEESEESSLGGFCDIEAKVKNMRLLQNSKKLECDPSSQSLDVGIKSCGEEDLYFCEASEESSLGGFCNNYDYSGPLCDPTDPDYNAAMNCNCDDMDTMKTGIVRCLPRGDGCCVEEADGADSFCASVTMAYNLIEGFPAYVETCYKFTSPYEEEKTVSCTNRSNVEYSCVQTINDEACSSCAVELDPNEDGNECILSDCWNIDVAGARAGNTCDGDFPLPLIDLFVGNPTCAGTGILFDDDDDVDDGENTKKAIIAAFIVIPALLTLLIVCYKCRRRKSTGKEAVNLHLPEQGFPDHGLTMEPSINLQSYLSRKKQTIARREMRLT
jgi:hypothetical protein